MPGSEAIERAARWRQARKDKKAAEAIIEAEQHWFAAHGGDAGEFTLDDETTVKRTEVNTKAYTKRVAANRYWRWSV